ncbi:MAG: diguanylate cyclase [Burkholderiales bacterium RIFCSPLOWO2_12_FULL_65_40]|nr:MAG: diguanylate cyclase [Burkholderiales bacterium RIFCSPLOWO2_12_FULL_65_40]
MKPLSPLRINALVWAIVAAFLLVLVLAAGVLAWSNRQEALEGREEQVARFVSGAEVALNRSFLSVDLLLSGTDSMLGLSTSMADWIDASTGSQLLGFVTRGNLLVSMTALIDADGRVLASSESAETRNALQLPSGFLQQALSPAASSLLVSEPAISFNSTQSVLYFARPLKLANGARLVVVAEVPRSKLAAVLMQGADVSGLEVVLERSDGRALLTIPDLGEQARLQSVLPLKDLPDSAWGVPGRLSGELALVVSRPLIYQNLRISASLPESTALADWHRERNTLVAITLAFCLMVLVAGAMVVSFFNHITAARHAMAQSKVMLDQALESMVSGFVLLDQQQRVLHWNRRFEEIFPWVAGIMAPQLPFRRILEITVRHYLPQASEAEMLQWVELRLARQRVIDGVHEQEQPDGRCIQIVERPTPEGGLVITYHDVTALRRANAEIESLAFYDPLTGLPNRRLLLDRLGQASVLAQRSGQLGALLFLDLDHFKALNDTLGHEVGDELLQQVAQRLRACVRVADTVARLGGDEFVVMLNELSSSTEEAAKLAQRIGEKILHGLSQPYVLKGHAHQSGCSIGATLFGGSLQTATELLKQADIAMYQVKARRGNGLCFFDPRMQVAINDRAQLEADLREALAQGQFALHYQPQFTPEGCIVGAEVLLRWQHPERGMVSPAQFIAVAEESDLILHIGQWVLRTACQQLALWQQDPRSSHLQLSVNVSARQFRQPEFVRQVTEIIQETGVRSHLLTLELTESLVLDNVDDAIEKMHQLRTKGVRFSVDDFGTGYSSLAYLTRLPLHQLKIDQSFVRNLGARATDDVIVQTIIGMARNLELEVIAEGVETQEQKDFLVRHGCDLYQGYLLGRPMPVDALDAVLAGEAASAA